MTFEERHHIISIEENTKPNNPFKTAAIASIGGMLGAGLDTYLSGKVDPSDFIRPMAAWGAGGALGGIGGISEYLKNTKNKIQHLKESK